MPNTTAYQLTPEQRQWSSRRRQGLAAPEQREMLINQNGLCALSGVPMQFGAKERSPIKSMEKGMGGCHPLAPAIDHISPGSDKKGFQIICYAINDLKGHLPYECYEALIGTQPWINLMTKWKTVVNETHKDEIPSRHLLRECLK